MVKKIMQKYRSCLGIAGLLITHLALASAPRQILPMIDHWQTTQGTPVYFVPTQNVPILDVGLIFNAGSARDGQHPGLANFTSTLINDGTAHLSADALASALDSVGAQLEINSQRDFTAITLRTLVKPTALLNSLQTLQTMLHAPLFAPSEIIRERAILLAAIRQNDQNPSVLANQAFFKTLYPKQAYQYPVLGTPKALQNITRTELQHFYRTYFVAQNADILLVGDITAEKAHQIADKLSQELPQGYPAPAIPMALKTSVANTVEITYPTTQAEIRVGQVGVSRQSADYFSLMVGNYILGGGSLVSRLFHDVREARGLTYSVYSQFNPLAARGPFVISLQTRATQANIALKVVKETLQKFLDQGPSQAEVQAAKQFLLGNLPLQLNSNANILNYLTLVAFYHLPLNYLDLMRDKIATVTPEMVKAAFDRHIDLKHLVTVVVQPVAHVNNGA